MANKAILVISDMPSRCGDCPLLEQMYDDEHEEWYEVCFWRQCKIDDTERKLSVCPLKPTPEKKGQHHEIPANSPFPMLDGIAVLMDGVNEEYNEGWNDCIDELVGEKQ